MEFASQRVGCGTYTGCSGTTFKPGLLCKMRISGGLAGLRVHALVVSNTDLFESESSKPYQPYQEGEKHIPPDQGVDLLITEEGTSAMRR